MRRSATRFAHWFGVGLLLVGVFARAAETTEADLKKAFLSLKEGATKNTVKIALDMLDSAEIDAFPVLVRELNNPTPAAQKFFPSNSWEIDPITQVAKQRKTTTLGDVAFILLQDSIEETFPREFCFFQILNRDNIAEWLAARQYLSLYELRAEAARESLAKAEAQYKIDQSAHSRNAVNFIRDLVARYNN